MILFELIGPVLSLVCLRFSVQLILSQVQSLDGLSYVCL